jgi:hypothetical protein
MAAPILIDANIYLRLYESRQVQKLANALLDVRSQIYVTQQIVDEVTRNRLRCVRDSFDNGLRAMTQMAVPDFEILRDSIDETQIAQVLSDAKKLADDAKKKKELITDAAFKALERVAAGTDALTRQLAPLFENPKKPTHEEMERARLRRELGNPPGKPDDPLGDQITWEQFIAQLGGAADVWIVSNDFDYSVTFEGRSFLNARLSEDLRGRKIHIHRELSAALEHFKQATNTAMSLPPKEKLEEIGKTERALTSQSHLLSARVLKLFAARATTWRHWLQDHEGPEFEAHVKDALEKIALERAISEVKAAERKSDDDGGGDGS